MLPTYIRNFLFIYSIRTTYNKRFVQIWYDQVMIIQTGIAHATRTIYLFTSSLSLSSFIIIVILPRMVIETVRAYRWAGLRTNLHGVRSYTKMNILLCYRYKLRLLLTDFLIGFISRKSYIIKIYINVIRKKTISWINSKQNYNIILRSPSLQQMKTCISKLFYLTYHFHIHLRVQ